MSIKSANADDRSKPAPRLSSVTQPEPSLRPTVRPTGSRSVRSTRGLLPARLRNTTYEDNIHNPLQRQRSDPGHAGPIAASSRPKTPSSRYSGSFKSVSSEQRTLKLSAAQARLKAWQRERQAEQESAMSEELARIEIKQAQHKLKQAKQRVQDEVEMARLEADIIEEFADEGEPDAVSQADETHRKEFVLQWLDDASRATSPTPPPLQANEFRSDLQQHGEDHPHTPVEAGLQPHADDHRHIPVEAGLQPRADDHPHTPVEAGLQPRADDHRHTPVEAGLQPRADDHRHTPVEAGLQPRADDHPHTPVEAGLQPRADDHRHTPVEAGLPPRADDHPHTPVEAGLQPRADDHLHTPVEAGLQPRADDHPHTPVVAGLQPRANDHPHTLVEAGLQPRANEQRCTPEKASLQSHTCDHRYTPAEVDLQPQPQHHSLIRSDSQQRVQPQSYDHADLQSLRSQRLATAGACTHSSYQAGLQSQFQHNPCVRDDLQQSTQPQSHDYADLQSQLQYNPCVCADLQHSSQLHNLSLQPPHVPSHSALPPHIHKTIDGWIDNLVIGQETVVVPDLHQNSSFDTLARAIIGIEGERDLPHITLPVFNGGALSWPKFVEQFHAQVHCRPGISDTRRMDLLQSHLTGDAKKLVQGLGYSGRHYALTLKELKAAFGHPVTVSRAYIERATSGPVIASSDPASLREFYVSIRDCVTTLQMLNNTSDLCSSDVLLRTAKRLPREKIGKWNEFVKSIAVKRMPTIIDLQNWLKDRVYAEFNPYAVKVSNFRKSSANNNVPGNKSVTLNATISSESHVKSVKRPSTEHAERNDKYSCPLCNEKHDLYKCPKFNEKSPKERWAIVKSKGYCFNCLRHGHGSRDCKSKINCRKDNCNKRHHTSLHFAPERDEASNLLTGSVGKGRKVFFQIIPVLLSGQNGRVIKTYALLDTASEVTLIHDDLARDLGLKGMQKKLTIKTISSKTTVSSNIVSVTLKGTEHLAEPVHIAEVWTTKDKFPCPGQHINRSVVYEHLHDLNFCDVLPEEVQILIGANVPQAHIQIEVRRGLDDQPMAIHTALGWSVMGTTYFEKHTDTEANVNLISTQDKLLNDQVEQFWKTESFGVNYNSKIDESIEDRHAMSILNETAVLVNGHYQVGMLWKRKSNQLPNNKYAAQCRFSSLVRRFNRDESLKTMYVSTMNDYISKGYACKMADDEIQRSNPRTWYLPHHGVSNPNKPGKVRVVFDAAATYAGTSLNQNLMTGPDLLNNLFGVLQRFRLYPVALTADVQGMFHQVKVPEIDSDSLRFLWKEDMQNSAPPDTYRMNVHIFGAADSPCCANYALRRTANENSDKFCETTINTVLNNFYVDDMMTSVNSETEAITLYRELVELLSLGGFHLCKLMSNSKAVLTAVSESERAIQDLNLDLNQIPVQRALGLRWNVHKDTFVFIPQPKTIIPTKRGVVSAVSSIFDPCGFLAPFSFRAKCLIQELWRKGIGWDEPMSEELESVWFTWNKDLENLCVFKLPRHHTGLTDSITSFECHVFCDASEKGFGAVCYLRYHVNGNVVCSFLAAKTRVAPISTALSIPRLELQGAVLAVRLWNHLQAELHICMQSVTYWTDSTTVLRYIKNETKRFKPFVANRVAEICEFTQSSQWRHVPTAENPADFCTRGLSANALTIDHPWLGGPQFLKSDEEFWPSLNQDLKELENDDPEVKSGKTVLLTKAVTPDSYPLGEPSIFHGLNLDPFFDSEKFSKWIRLKRCTAWFLRAIKNFLSTLSRFKLESVRNSYLSISELQEAELCWVRQAQHDTYSAEVEHLCENGELNIKDSLLALRPFYDGRHLHVGGRLRKAHVPLEAKYQLILPTSHRITYLIFNDAHVKLKHCGPEQIISYLRQNYWPVNARRIAKGVISKCLYCKKQRVKPNIPVMADLPKCRTDVFSGPFYHTGVDYFGPMVIKRGRSSVKRWGCLFTCLTTRAVHLELADSLSTDDFILALRSFISRRGQPHDLYSDNATNFVGANNELKLCLENLDQKSIDGALSQLGIQWHFNPPLAPHFGGAWERLVKTTKIALKAVLKEMYVCESVLRTALTEVEAVINSRPLTHNSSEPSDYTALTPNHFLRGRAYNTTLPDHCSQNEINSRKHWRQTQVIADHVNRRWLREYLPTLTIRSKWHKDVSPVSQGDLVIVVDYNLPRGQWELGRVTETIMSDDGKVRSVRVRTAKNTYMRPVAKNCVFEENVK